MKVTMQQIAEMCNVSRGTVDRVVHNRPNVHPQIRQSILAALHRTGYRAPSQEQTGVQHTVGVILPGWPDRYFGAHAQRGMRIALAKLDQTRFTIAPQQLRGRSVQEHLEAIDALLEQKVSGIIINAPMVAPIIDRLNDATKNGVRVMTYFDEIPQCLNAYYVGLDVVRAGRVAAGLMAKYFRASERVLAVSGDLSFHSHRGRVYSFAHHFTELTGAQSAVEIVYCHEFFEATAQTVHKQLLLDDRIRYIYMATQSVPGCIEGIRRAQLPYRITVICNDTTAAAKEFLQTGEVDFIIGQSVTQTFAQAIEMMYQMLCFANDPRSHKIYHDPTIYTKQMLRAEGGSK